MVRHASRTHKLTSTFHFHFTKQQAKLTTKNTMLTSEGKKVIRSLPSIWPQNAVKPQLPDHPTSTCVSQNVAEKTNAQSSGALLTQPETRLCFYEGCFTQHSSCSSAHVDGRSVVQSTQRPKTCTGRKRVTHPVRNKPLPTMAPRSGEVRQREIPSAEQ